MVLSTVRSYDRGMMCGEPATTFGFIHPGYMHTAVMPGREIGYNRRVHYRVGSPEVGWSGAASFVSGPEPAAVAQGRASFTFLVFNDVGQENAVVFNDICPPYCPGGWAWVNYTANSSKLAGHLLQEGEARLALLVGDLSYANGVQADWDYFGHQFQAPFSRWPLMVATGNHERDQPFTGDALNDKSSDSGGECNVPYTYRYYTPAWETTDPYAQKGAVGKASSSSSSSSTGRSSRSSSSTRQASKSLGRTSSSSSGSSATSSSSSGRGPAVAAKAERLAEWQHKKPGKPGDDWWQQQQLQNLPTALNPYKSYYSFSMATVHFIMLDSESPSHRGSPQHNFVVQDLAKVDRARHPWLVVGLHRMMAGPTTDPINVQNMARLQADYEELFKQHSVHLVLQGHEHAYARTCPLYKGKCFAAKPDGGSSSSSGKRRGTGSTLTSSSRTGSSSSSRGSTVLQVLQDPQAPVYVLAGHAGAGFTHAFPAVLPSWVAFGVQDQNGYLRVTVSGGRLTLVSLSTDDGHVIDGVQIVKKAAEAAATAKKHRQQ
uniref:Purple acid phosphatase C-terminal domain-containing protein n=1 Tax=Tetradesmus obliquus TaxID=3088 RepID=A0A383W7I1_TETOB|eukprot:jgi/Sobl393_1/7342/SZX72646.1